MTLRDLLSPEHIVLPLEGESLRIERLLQHEMTELVRLLPGEAQHA